MNRREKRKEAESRVQSYKIQQEPDKNVFRLQALIVFAFAFFIYANTIWNKYAVDDTIVITKNTLTKQGFAGIPKLLTTDAFYGFFGEGYKLVEGGRYRPLSLVTFAIEYQFFGMNPHISHFINVLLFALMGALIFFLLIELLQPKAPAAFSWNIPFIAALLFVAHPIHTEAVANIKGRDEIMGMLGALLTLYCAVLFVKKENLLFLLLTFVSFVFALFSKENALTYFAVVPLAFYFFTNADVKKYLVVCLPMLVIAVVYVLMRQEFTGLELGQRSPEILNNPFVNYPANDAEDVPAAKKFATIAVSFWEYIRLLFFPHPLTHDYYYNQAPITTWSDPKAIFSLLINLGLIAYGVLGMRTRSVIAFSILYYFTTMSIVSNIPFTVGIIMNERFLFLASFGFCIILAVLLVKLTNYIKAKDFDFGEILNPAMLTAILVFILAGYSVKAITRNMDWKDDFTLFKKDVQTSTGSAKIRNALGGEYLTQADQPGLDAKTKMQYIKNAEKVLGEALKIYPDYMNALLLMGNAKYKINDSLPEAVYYYKRTLEMKPEYFEGNFNLGCVLLEKNRAAESIPYFRKALKIKGDKFESAYNLAEAYFKSNQPDSAIVYYRRVIPLVANDAGRQALCYYKTGLCYGKKKDLENTARNISKAFDLDPTKFTNEEIDDPDFAIEVYRKLLGTTTDVKRQALYYYKIGLCYGKMKNDFDNAIANISKAIELDPKNVSCYEDLGVAYGFKQDYENALKTFEKALEINPKYSKLYYNLAVTYKQLGNDEKANEYFAKQKEAEAGRF